MCASPVHRLLVVTIAGSAKTLGSIRISYLNVRSRELLSFPARTTFWRGTRIGVHPKHFSPSSVQLKSEINGACLCKQHQKRHLEFCTAYLLSRMPQVRVPPVTHVSGRSAAHQ